MSTRSKALLSALIGWTAFVWAQRLVNAWSASSDEATAAKVVSTVLAVVFLGFAAGGAGVLVRCWHAPPDRPAAAMLVAFAVWTTGVWVVRTALMLLADHSVGFKVVHAGLAVVSIVLAWGVAGPLARRWSTTAVPG